MPDFLLMFLLTLKNADFVNAAFKRSPQNKIHLWCRSHLLPSFLSPPAGDYQHPPHFLIFFFLKKRKIYIIMFCRVKLFNLDYLKPAG